MLDCHTRPSHLPPTKKRRIQAILDTLERLYPDADCELRYDTPFQLLVATVLSAQSTDKRVNMVTERLFKEYGTPEAMAALEPEELEPWIKELGLYRNKARQIVHAARMIVEEHGGQVPSERSALEALPGVGRKTANVVLSNAFSIPALAVDTHVFRVARRLGLAVTKSPEQTERVLYANPAQRIVETSASSIDSSRASGLYGSQSCVFQLRIAAFLSQRASAGRRSLTRQAACLTAPCPHLSHTARPLRRHTD